MQVGSPRASLSPTTLGYYPSLGTGPLRGRRVRSQAGRAGGCAAGSVLGADGSSAPRACRMAPEEPEPAEGWPGLVGQGTEPGQGAMVWRGLLGVSAGSGGSCLLCFLLLQPSCPWGKTLNSRSELWQLRRSLS